MGLKGLGFQGFRVWDLGVSRQGRETEREGHFHSAAEEEEEEEEKEEEETAPGLEGCFARDPSKISFVLRAEHEARPNP